MKEQFIPYELALKLKEIGFDKKCFAYFNGEEPTRIADRGTLAVDKINTWRNTFLTIKNQEPFVYTPEPDDADTNPNYERLKWGTTVSAPLWQQVFDWFEEKYNLQGSFGATNTSSNEKGFTVIKLRGEEGYERLFADFKMLDKKEARQACLEKLIEIAKIKT